MSRQIPTTLIEQLLLLVMLLWQSAAFAEVPVVLRTRLSTNHAWVGQKVLFQIDVLAKDGWATLKHIDTPSIPGAYMKRFETQGTRLNEGEYSGQRYEFLLYPQKAGILAIPGIPVEVEVKFWGSKKQGTTQTLTTKSVELQAALPEGVENSQGLISTARFTAKQQWQPESGRFKVGDTLKRTITLQADDVPGMAFAPLVIPSLHGVSIYPSEPEVDDRFDRGELVGKRTESITYLFEMPGELNLPDLIVSWWDTGSKQLNQIRLSGLRLKIEPNPDAQTSQISIVNRPRHTLRSVGLSSLVLLILAITYAFFRCHLHNTWKTWKKQNSKSEVHYFKQVRLATDSGDNCLLLRETMRWLDRITPDSHPARMDAFASQYGSDKLLKLATTLSTQCRKKMDNAHARAFYVELVQARTQWLNSAGKKHSAYSVLPELNKPMV